eukprot:TRINITY_DN2707_c0_g1_i1.p1 TRINITY_DN2707_c0_g1~~TRINITY_DN2707_c0_g1_i1.p1  ORF type:complete len:206 (+),score=69.99 TRINITY_DN2707_c0_g1_i1:112-729(+)
MDLFDSHAQPQAGDGAEFDPFADNGAQQFDNQPREEATTDEEVGGDDAHEDFDAPVASGQPIIIGGPPPQDAFAGFDDDNKGIEPADLGETPLSKWEAERAQILAQRRADALAAKEQQQATARDEIAKFYEDRESAIHKNVNRNRSEEKESRADLDSVMQYGTLWEKVARIVDLNPSAAKTYKRADLVRMRTLLLQLKNDNPSKK